MFAYLCVCARRVCVCYPDVPVLVFAKKKAYPSVKTQRKSVLIHFRSQATPYKILCPSVHFFLDVLIKVFFWFLHVIILDAGVSLYDETYSFPHMVEFTPTP